MAILDQFGRPIASRELRKPETRTIAVAQIRDRWSSYPSNGLTPVRLAAILREADNGEVMRQAELFEEMEEKDAHLASQFQTRKLAVQGLEWEITPGDASAKAKKIALFVSDLLSGMDDWEENLLDMLDALAKGYSLMELRWDVSEGQAIVAGIDWVHAKKVTFHNSLTPRVLTEMAPVGGEDLQPFKWVYHRYKARSGYDTRAGIMRVCAWMYLFKNYAIKDWVGFAEVFGKPMRLGKYDAGASKEDKEALSLAVRMLGSDAAGIISKSTEIEFLEAKISGSLNIYQSLTDFCDAQMSKAILGQTLTADSGSNGSGSYALGKVHNQVRGDLSRSDAKALSKTITQQIVRPLVGFNFGWDTPMPVYQLAWEEPEDMEAIGRVYQAAADLIDISQEHVSERFKIPLRKDGETPLKSKAAKIPQQAQEPAPSVAKHILKQAPGQFTEEQQAVEELADDATAQAGEIVGANEQAILRVLQESASFDATIQALLELYPTISTTALEDLMQRALLNAEMYGRVTAKV